MDGDDWFTLAELGDRLGALVWVEEQLSSTLDIWSRVEATAAVAIVFATTSRHHAWHGEVVRSCLPTSPELGADDAVCAPTPGWQAAIETLNGLTDPDATVLRLKALARVVDPWLVRETNVLLELARPVSDAAMSRWLRFVELDHADDGSAVADMLATRSSEAVRVDDHLLIHELDLH